MFSSSCDTFRLSEFTVVFGGITVYVHRKLFENCSDHSMIADTLMDVTLVRPRRGRMSLLACQPIHRGMIQLCIFTCMRTQNNWTEILLSGHVKVSLNCGDWLLPASLQPSSPSRAPANFAQPAKDDNISRDKDTPDWQKLSSAYTDIQVYLPRVSWYTTSPNVIDYSFI